MLLALDFGSAYAIAVYIAGAILLWVGLLREGRNLAGWIRSKLSPPPPPPPPPLPKPAVVLGAAGGHISLGQEEGEPHRRLIRAEPRYLIENKGMTPVREIDTGVDTFDRTRSHRFEAFHALALSAGEGVWVENVGSIPVDMLADVHESAAFTGHLYWATFEDADGNRWKATYDPRSREHNDELLHRADAAAVAR